ncbi:Kinesin-like protein kip2 [Serendipita sp. 396]|nr:Kinesin-like protein kip2 [Serendipita sp. 396]KAG8789357.1 Kinesin-like protein kip2 [Serendipita sp. 397]KAG8804590.1 Kinesin-like protein kip2 [Serendipita sp. 398]KAG8878711.1 Kinesin-like protein kip2 [Serendipita sp. 405]
MNNTPKKFTPVRSGSHKHTYSTTSDTDGRASVASTSCGTSAGSFGLARGLSTSTSDKITPKTKSQTNDIVKGRSTLAVRSKSNVTARAPSPLTVSRSKSPIMISSSPQKTRMVTFEDPSSSPIKPTLSLNGGDDIPNQLVDATLVSEFDLSADFDVTEVSKMLADERAQENESSNEAMDKVLVSVRVKPADDEEDAWLVEHNNSEIRVKEQHARTTTGLNNEFRYDNVLTGSNNKTIYEAAARRHVRSAMEGFNAVIFAYGQTASGKTFTLSGTDEEPGVIPRAMRDVFAYIKATPDREYLLRASYLEIYNEQIHDLLASGVGASRVPVSLQGSGFNVTMSPLREEVVTSLKAVRDVMERGESNRRTASTDWNDRSSRSHSVFRLVIESRERSSETVPQSTTPAPPGGSRLHTQGASGVRMSVLSLIDLAGSERATSDKERLKEGKYINTSLLTLGTVIGTLAENASKSKSDYVPFRNSKLTRMLQPSLSGDARISVICTLNPSPSALSESLSTLGFASRIKKVALHATKKEVVDHEALIERYRQEIEELKAKLAEKDQKEHKLNRRLSTREKADEHRDKTDLNLRLKQLSKLILTSQTVDVPADSGAASPTKLDFDLSPYELQEELLSAKRRLESQETQILALEAALSARPLLPADAAEDDKDKLIAELQRANRELTFAVQGYEENLGEPLRQVKEDVEKEWKGVVERLEKELRESKGWAKELISDLEKEKQVRRKLEEEKRALVSFVTDIDVHMREKTSFSSSLPRLAITPRSSLGGSGVPRRKSLGTVLIESNNSIKGVGGNLGDVKEEVDEKENISGADAV